MSRIGAISVANVDNLDNPPKAIILQSKINPKGMPDLNANACIVIQGSINNDSYNVQLAFAFGADKIAIRRKSGSTTWTEWKYFTAK